MIISIFICLSEVVKHKRKKEHHNTPSNSTIKEDYQQSKNPRNETATPVHTTTMSNSSSNITLQAPSESSQQTANTNLKSTSNTTEILSSLFGQYDSEDEDENEKEEKE